MANFDSADLLSRVKALLNRPSTDEAITDAQYYVMAGDGQRRGGVLLGVPPPRAGGGGGGGGRGGGDPSPLPGAGTASSAPPRRWPSPSIT